MYLARVNQLAGPATATRDYRLQLNTGRMRLSMAQPTCEDAIEVVRRPSFDRDGDRDSIPSGHETELLFKFCLLVVQHSSVFSFLLRIFWHMQHTRPHSQFWLALLIYFLKFQLLKRGIFGFVLWVSVTSAPLFSPSSPLSLPTQRNTD